MLFRQFVDEDLGCASYLIGDEQAGLAVVVDPAYAVEPYLEEAERRGVRIVRVLETHTHADHVSGHGRFALEHGVPVSVHPAGNPEFPFEALADGDEIDVGAVRIRVLHTPGHRPEHCAFAVIDTERAPEPWLVLTGDSLFVGDAGRPDLAVAALDGARELYSSLQRLFALPEGVEIYPGHVAGSLCGAGMSSKPSSTVGFERRYNTVAPLLDDEHEFVSHSVGGGAAPKPPNMERIVALNRGPFVGAPPELSEVDDADGATILDVRPAAVFASGHAEKAFNVPVSGTSFATKAAFILDPEERIVIDSSSADEAREAARGLRAVGFVELAGYRTNPPADERLEPIALEELEDMLARREIQVLDVREPSERDGGYIAESRNIPYRLLRSSADVVAGNGPVATICESGARAGIAASILAAAGVETRPVLEGGISAWQARGNQTVRFRRCGS